jgi:hypothetical protein
MFTDPPLAHVGLSEGESERQGVMTRAICGVRGGGTGRPNRRPFAAMHETAFGHKADIQTVAGNVRFWG